MKKMKAILQKVTVCLFAVVCLCANISTVANAAEIGERERDRDAASVAIIEVQSYTIEGGMIEAGKDITVNLTLHNTATNVSANNILMTLSNSNGSLYPVYGNSNQVYVGTISADQTKVIPVKLTIGNTFTGNAVDLSCDFVYESANTRMNNTSTIVIPTSGGSTIGVKSVDMTSHAIVNGKSLLAFSYVNQSSSNITDAKLLITGKVSTGSKEIKLDTVYAGKSYTEDLYVTFVEPGDQEINISLQYTDTDGTQRLTDLGNYDVTVSKESSFESENNGGSNVIFKWVGIGVAGIVGLIALIAVISYIRKR